MSQSPISITSLPPEKRELFKQLTSAPAVAWPTVIMWLAVTIVMVGSDILAVTEVIPLWVATLVNAVVGYLAFSVVHDTIHRSGSTNTRFNDAMGQAAVLLFAPYVSLKLFRWSHILHHRFASGPRDPDIILHGAWWTLPFRWMFIDLLYLRHVVKHGDKVSKGFFKDSLWLGAASLIVIVGLTAMGYGLHVLMLWFIPSRLVLLTLGFSFFWLPHVPHDTPQEVNFTKATTVRLGHEWLMSPLLQFQNFHLIHHLYPFTPFYNNAKVWRLIEPQLREKDLAIQHGFDIIPTIYPAPKNR